MFSPQHAILAVALIALATLGAAAPAQLVPRDVSSDVLSKLTLFAEYSAAAYCPTNLNSTGTKVVCKSGLCPQIETAETNTLQEFNEKCEYGDVTGFLAVDKTNKLLVLSFRGSSSAANWIADLDFGFEDVSALCTGCQAHGGFWRSWQTVSEQLNSGLKSAVAAHPDYTVVVTGHSFGAAVAALGATELRNNGFAVQTYTYGEPRIGNTKLAEYITAQGGNYRVTHTNDIVPRLPPHWLGFSHSSPEYWITSGDDVTVTTKDVTVVEGVGATGGNAGEGIATSVDAHHWYLVHIDSCNSD